MKNWGPKLGLLTLAALAAGSSYARAGDWSIEAVSTLELNIAENRAIRDKSLGTSIAAISKSTLNVGYAMPDGVFKGVADLTSERYFGEASEDGVDNYFPHLGFEWSKSGRNDTIGLTGDYRIQSVTLQKALDSPVPLPIVDTIPVGATQSDYELGASWTHQANRRNTFTFSTDYTKTVYSNDEVVIAGVTEHAGIDNTVLANAIVWDRKVNRNNDLKIKAGLDWIQLEDPSSTDNVVYSLSAELTRRLNARLKAIVGGGIETVETIVPAGHSYSTDYTFTAGLDYTLKNDSITWRAVYGVNQGGLGSLAKQATTSVSYRHQINDLSSFNAEANLTLAKSRFGGGLGSNLVFQFTPTYNLALARDWDFSAGYRMVYQSDQYDAMSSTVFMSLTRDLHILR